MKTFQNILLVAGATALGVSACVGTVFGLLEAMHFGHGGHNDMGGAGLAILLLIGCTALGGFLGFGAGFLWVIKHESRPWPARIWVGVILGILISFALHFAAKLPRVPELIEMFELWPVTVVAAAGLGMLGGMFAKFTGIPRRM